MAIAELREKIIRLGKTQKKFLDLGRDRNRMDDPKYADPNNIDDSGAITKDDALFLYDYVQKHRPLNIWEFGTWFGTSAYIMAQAVRDIGAEYATVRTCDKHDVFVSLTDFEESVKYYHMHSTDFLKRLISRKCHLVFADATLKAGDAELITAAFDGPVRFITHDYYGQAKGLGNIAKMKAACKGKRMKLSVEGQMAIYEETE